MRNILRKYIAVAAALLLLGGCIKDHLVGGFSGEGTITLRLSLPQGNGLTRSIAAEPDATGENRIDEIAILALTQKGSDWVFDYEARIVSKVQSDGELTVTARVREMSELQQFVILVNAQDELTAAAPARYEKIDDIESRLVCSTGGGEWPANNNGDGNFTPFPMYARTAAQIVSESSNPVGTYSLIRMVARINVTLNGGINNFTLEEACLFNYRTAGYVSYGKSGFNGTKATAPAVPASGNHTGDPVKGPTVVYEAVSGEILSSIYTFESPAITTDAGRTTGTALVIGGYYNGETTDKSYYRVDLKTDSDLSANISSGILRNHSYEVEIESVTGAGYGTAEEAYMGSKPIGVTVKVIDWGAENRFPLGLKIQPSANCYLVAPGETFGIPVFGQVQRAMNAGDLSSEWITNDMDLKAHFLWSDNSEVNGVVNTSKLRVIKSSSSQSTTMLVETGNKTGNAVVAVYEDKTGNGVYDGTDEIKWSWHIWVTDYDPDKQINGTTHVYAGDAFTSGIYVGKRIMDRNLGTTWTGGTPSPSAIGSDATKAAKAYGLLYQWGRKDPFTPASGNTTGSPTGGGIVTIYNASGATLSENGTGVKLVSIPPSTANNLPNAVRNPLTFYFNATSPHDWYTNTGARNDNLWCENGVTPTAGSKTAYDPCPPGWRVPIGGNKAINSPWAGFGDGIANSTTNGTNVIFSWYYTGTNYGASNSTYVTHATAGRYYTGSGANAWHPASSYRSHGSGAFENVGTNGYNWSAATTGTFGYNLTFFSNYVNPAYNSNRATGYPVRCIQDDSYNPTPAGPTLTTDSEDRKILTDGNTYNIKVTSNTTWIASIKRGTNEVTIGDSEVLGLPLLNEETGFNDGLVTSYVGGGTAATTTEKTITVKTVDYISLDKYAEGSFVIVFRDGTTGQIIHETTINVMPSLWARSNIVWDAANNRLTFAVSPNDNSIIPANSGGVLFKWGSLVAISPARIGIGTGADEYISGKYPAGIVVYDPTDTYVYTYANIPYINSSSAPFDNGDEVDDDFSGYGAGGIGFDTNGRGDICRYISAQNGWVKGKWRLPTQKEYNDLIAEQTSISYGTWGGFSENEGSSIYGNNAYGFSQRPAGQMLGLGVTSVDNILNPVIGVYFPNSEYRGTSGRQGGTGLYAYYWSGSSSGGTNTFDLAIRSTGALNGTHERQDAFAVRCIRE